MYYSYPENWKAWPQPSRQHERHLIVWLISISNTSDIAGPFSGAPKGSPMAPMLDLLQWRMREFEDTRGAPP